MACPAGLAPTAHPARCCPGADEHEVQGQVGDSERPGGTVPKGRGWNWSRGCLQEAPGARGQAREWGVSLARWGVGVRSAVSPA